MRKKIEELRNREEGFTLVELLAVIVILGIIVAIAIPAIGNVIENADKNATAAEQEMIVDAARLYFMDPDNKDEDQVTVDDLKAAGYIEERGSSDESLPEGYVKNETPYKFTDGAPTGEDDSGEDEG